MRQAIHQPLNMIQAISFGILTTLLSLAQPISITSAQQLPVIVTNKASDAGIQAQRIESLDPNHPHPARFVEKRDSQTSTRTPHRLIRKPQNAPVASLEPSHSGSGPVSSLLTGPPPVQSDATTSQSTEPQSLQRSVGAAVPLATMNVAPSPATAKGSFAASSASSGTVPLAATGAGNSSTSGHGGTGGRSMSRLAAEMPALAQLISPSSVPAVPVNPAIGASPASFSFTAQTGTNPAVQTLSLSNTGSGSLTWSASGNAAWLILSPASGTGNGTVTLSVATGVLTTGTYTGMIAISAPGATTVSVPVAFTVTAAPVPPAIGASPTSLSFTAQQGGSNPANQTLNLSNTGGGTLTWSASDDAPWLTLSPATGTGNGTVTLTAATGTLTASTYNGTITIAATGASSRTVPVTFTVTAIPNITLNPSNLSYAATQGATNPANQTVALTNTGGTANWTVSDNVAWLTASPASGSNSSTVTASVNTTGLTAGTYTGTITVSTAGASSKTVAVTLTISAPTTSSARLIWNANAESDLAGYKIYRRTASSTSYGAPLAIVPLASLPGGSTTYTASGQQSGSTYFFVITAYDNTGFESGLSNEVSRAF